MVRKIKRIILRLINLSKAYAARLLSYLPVSSIWVGPPKGYYRSSRNYVEKFNDETIATYNVVYPVSDVIHLQPPPLTTDEKIHWRFTKNNAYQFPDHFILTIRNGRVTGANCWIITHDDHIIFDVSREFGVNTDPGQMRIFKSIKLPKHQFIKGTVAVIGFAGPDNYWHWMYDILPRLRLLQFTGWLDKCDKIVVNPILLPYQKETFKLFNIPEEKILYSSKQMHIEANMLVVPSAITFKENVPEWVINIFKNELFVQRQDLTSVRRIYISRGKARTRKVLNESEVYSILQNYGFELIELEKYAVADQAKLFNSAAIIIAPHGASQTNLMFCKPHTKLIEIFSPLWVHYCFWSVSVQLGLDYYYFMGEGEFIAEENYRIDKDADIFVDLTKLKAILAKAGIA